MVGYNKVVGATSPFVEVTPIPLNSKRAPGVGDTNYPIGQIWIDITENPSVMYIFLGKSGWQTVGNGVKSVNGDLIITSGNVEINSSGYTLSIKSGSATDFAGTSTLVAGTVTISNTNIATSDLIFIQRSSANASTSLGELSYSITNATSFTVSSLIQDLQSHDLVIK